MSETASKLVVLSECEFTRGCLLHWLHACCPEFDIMQTADLGVVHATPAARPPAAIVIYATGWNRPSKWLERQIEVVEQYYKLIPVMLIADGLDPDLVRDMISRRAVDAVIPASYTTEATAAALRLVLAGGHLLHLMSGAVSSAAHPSGHIGHNAAEAPDSRLTVRERTVLELLKTGMPNKVIAHQLNLSLSTVKVHVHNIIRKLRVKNRTEAVIAAAKLDVPLDHFVSAESGIITGRGTGGNGLKFPGNPGNRSLATAPHISVKTH